MGDTMLDRARKLLQKHWGYPDFREAQVEVLNAVFNGKDTLAILSTSTGKTACYQVPALLKPGCAIVISPLIALMKDQVDDATRRNIPCSYINSHVDDEEIKVRLRGLQTGKFKLFYVAPERMSSKLFMQILQTSDINYVVADECHTISAYGHAFRPAYARLRRIVDMLGDYPDRPPIIAVTATATASIEADIVKSLGMHEGYNRIIGDPIRSNIHYNVRFCEDNIWVVLRTIVRTWDTRNGRHVIYVTTRAAAETIKNILAEIFSSDCVAHYHGGMDRKARTDVQDAFKNGSCPIVVATTAFGMGIDVPNIRSVVHFGFPGSIEDMVQGAGRAGRDGLPSKHYLLTDLESAQIQRYFIDLENPPPEYITALWSWLNARLKFGDVMEMTGKQIAEELNDSMRVPLTESHVHTILSIFEAKALVRRQVRPGGKGYSVTPSRFYRLAELVQTPQAKAVFDAIKPVVDEQVNLRLHPEGETLEVDYSVEHLSQVTGLGAYAVSLGLKQLGDLGVLTPVKLYRGKTVELLVPSKQLPDAISLQALKMRRLWAMQRFECLLEYTRLAERERVQYVRDYFLKGKMTIPELEKVVAGAENESGVN